MAHAALQTLRLFSEKADKLLASSAASSAMQRFSANMRVDDNGAAVAWFEGPDGEQVDAFVLTLRFFIQDNEPTSLRKMRGLYGDVAPADIASQFNALCAELNGFLDSPTHIRVNNPTVPLTHRQVFEAFVWGDLAHANAAHRQLFEIMCVPLGMPEFKGVLAHCLRVFTLAIARLNVVNKNLVEALQADA